VPTTAASRPLRWLPLAFVLLSGALAAGACYDNSPVPTQQQAGAWVPPPPPIPVVPPVEEPYAPPIDLAFVVDTGATPGGRLVFAVGDDSWLSSSQIYSMLPDGTGLTPLTPSDEDAWQPVWSPDDALIAYGLWDAGIMVMRADGSGRHLVSYDGRNPFWLPGGRIGFACDGGICAVDASGANRTRLLDRPDGGFDSGYTYSPDGSMIAFVHFADNATHTFVGPNLPYNIWVMRRDGTELHRLTTTDSASTTEVAPSWSRDGKQIAFFSSRYGIAVADADGGRLHGVSHSPSSRVIGLSGPSWSPDGTKVLFTDSGKLYIANADGSGLIRRVTFFLPGGYPFGSLSWSSR
jgi:Tol biopolymer transport system component